ncbi:MAG: hypothetical protein II034_07880 [Muribaculaceae bacterium]|nr:hypothetical protein [Muribaculaceae bacterium]
MTVAILVPAPAAPAAAPTNKTTQRITRCTTTYKSTNKRIINLNISNLNNYIMKKTILFESSGTVTLQDGFKVERGAEFVVHPSSF